MRCSLNVDDPYFTWRFFNCVDNCYDLIFFTARLHFYAGPFRCISNSCFTLSRDDLHIIINASGLAAERRWALLHAARCPTHVDSLTWCNKWTCKSQLWLMGIAQESLRASIRIVEAAIPINQKMRMNKHSYFKTRLNHTRVLCENKFFLICLTHIFMQIN